MSVHPQGNSPYPTQQDSPYPTTQQTQYGVYGQPSTTIVTAQPVVQVAPSFRETPVRMNCTFCHADIYTTTTYETGTFTWIACFVLWCVGLGLGCCLIPFCLNACKDCVHSCPNCHQVLGRHSRM